MRARTSTHGPADRTQSALEHLLRVPQRARPGGTRGQRGDARKGAQKGLTTVDAGFDFAPAFPTANSSWYGALPPSFIGSVRASPSRTFGTLYSKIAKWRPSVRAAGAGSSSVAKRCVSPAFGTCYPLLHLPHHQHVVRHDHGHVGSSPRHIASTAIDEVSMPRLWP